MQTLDASPDLAAAMLRTAHAVLAAGEIVTDDDLRAIADAVGIDTGNNANAIVPWADPQIPFECGCGVTIYSDTAHSHED
jgi:hypothetical protein